MSILDYYGRRAPEYERVYDKPERQEDLARLGELLRETLSGRHVLEVACGTGYWTERVAPAVRSLVATDGGTTVLETARAKELPETVRFARADAYYPGSAPEVSAAAPFDAALAAFWWSHVPLARLRPFLTTLHALLVPGAVVCLCDNRFVEGSSTPVTRIDEHGNHFQSRRLADGSEHEVLKNFPTPTDLRKVVTDVLSEAGDETEVVELEHYWVLRYTLPVQRRAVSSPPPPSP
jgi:SAM-dependent methyltransferase